MAQEDCWRLDMPLSMDEQAMVHKQPEDGSDNSRFDISSVHVGFKGIPISLEAMVCRTATSITLLESLCHCIMPYYHSKPQSQSCYVYKKQPAHPVLSTF